MGRRVADRRREEEVAPRLAVRLRVLEADGLEALADGARRLVAGQEALAGQDHGIGGLDELVRVLFQAHLRRRGARGRALLRRERLRRHERRRRRAEGQGEDGGLHRGPAGRGARGEGCNRRRGLLCGCLATAAMACDATGAGRGAAASADVNRDCMLDPSMRTRRAERLFVHDAQQSIRCCVQALRLGRGVAPGGCTK